MRLIIDTNIWSRLADHHQQYPFARLVREKGLEVVVPPATLLEVMWTPDRAARKAAVRLVCRDTWRRLKTEAESEANDLVGEINRLRPKWLRTQPDPGIVADLERFWLRAIWELARSGDRRLLADAQTKGAAERASILNLQRTQQAQWREEGIFRSLEEAQKAIRTLRLGPGSDPNQTRQAELEGWEAGTSVEPWRWYIRAILWDALAQAPIRTAFTGEHTTYADWVGAYVDLSTLRASQRDFGHLLLYEVDEKRMPRAWLRWAVHFAQHSARLGQGNPVDAQLATYLVEADLFVTNDRRLARSLKPSARALSPRAQPPSTPISRALAAT
jgi:hypothetical protein